MSITRQTGRNVRDGSIARVDLNTDQSGEAVIVKAVAGPGIILHSTGADSGTGDVTIGTDVQLRDTLLWTTL